MIVVLTFTFGSVAVWRNREVYAAFHQERRLRAWTEDLLVGSDSAYWEAKKALLNLRPGDREASCKAFDSEIVPLLTEALERKDDRLWKAYSILKQGAPGRLAGWLPEWPDPERVRCKAAYELGLWSATSAVPALCMATVQDASPLVRHEALEAVSKIGADSDVAFDLMEAALLQSTNDEACGLAVEWFFLAQPAPEKAVAPLLRVLQDPCSAANDGAVVCLARYGERASFAKEELQRLVTADDDDVAWAAFVALADIDPEAAKATGYRYARTYAWSTEQWRTNQ